MSNILAKNTQPEIRVRKYLYNHGCRYRLHVSSLPGKPDLVFGKARVCVFVHGCFWHGCSKCVDGRRRPKTNKSYWLPKIRRNRARDRSHVRKLRANGWKILTIWECETTSDRKLERLCR